MSDSRDKLPLQSKKFIAYLISDFGWKIIILYMLMHLKSNLAPSELTFLLTVVITSGVIQIGYILGQGALDRYLHTATEIFDREDQDLKQTIAKLKEENKKND